MRAQSVKGDAESAVKHAIASGYRHVDCAFDYNNEDEVGRALAAKVEDGTVTRQDVFVTTKVTAQRRVASQCCDCALVVWLCSLVRSLLTSYD